jgi:hypothetical protein
MPYIKDKLIRGFLKDIVVSFISTFETKGNLNYFLFLIAKRTCKNYEDYRNFIGEIESAKLEIYRRLVAPYEDKKIEENGDVE